MSLAKPISTSVRIRGIVFAILGVTGLGAALLNARWSRPGILVGLVFLFLAGITFSKATQIARFFRPFVKESVRVEVWGLPLPASSAAIFEIDSISAIGAGLLIQLRAASGGRRSLLKVAQPGSARLEEDRVEIGEAAYISWAGTKLRPPVGKKPPALVLLRRSNPS